MSYSQEIDYHIELSSLKEFTNKWVDNKVVPIDANYIFKILKQAVINSEIAPFLRKPVNSEKDGYYDKYLRLEEENKSYNSIPDFFMHKGDFYDMDRNLNFSRTYINDDIFQVLFALKLIELQYSKINLKEFLDFQLYDNYNGNKETYSYLLIRLLEKDSISYLLPSINVEIQQWMKANEISIDLNQDEIKTENEDITNVLKVDHWEAKKNTIMEGKMSIEEIRHFFSFLYKEKLEKSSKDEFKPILTKEEVDTIFSNGLIIPEKPLEKKFKLILPPRYPRKIVDFAIHKFFSLNTFSYNDKKVYVLFFANYIQDYESALNSKTALDSLSKNITGERSRKDKINWDEYLPSTSFK